MAKNRKKIVKKKKVEIYLPVPPDCPDPEEVVFVPVPVPPENVEPLAAPVGPTRCVLTLKETFWQGTPYIVLTAAQGQVLPESLKTGQEVDVQFSPPASTTTQSQSWRDD